MKKLILTLLSVASLAFASKAQSFFEGFEINALPVAGWDTINISGPTPGQSEAWFHSSYFTAPPAALEGTAFFAADYYAVGGADTINSWLFTPVALLKNGDKFMFYSRTVNNTVTYPDRLEIRLGQGGASINVGSTPNSVGIYTLMIGVINPSLTTTGYPSTWTKFAYTLSGLPGGGVSGRFAFRYFVDDAGPLGNNASAIAIDSVYYQPTVATGISSAVNKNNFSISPNPTSGSVKLSFKTNSDNREVIVQNMVGSIVYREKVSSLENSIDLSDLSKGVYFVNIKQDGVVYTEKLTIE